MVSYYIGKIFYGLGNLKIHKNAYDVRLCSLNETPSDILKMSTCLDVSEVLFIHKPIFILFSGKVIGSVKIL